MPTFTVDALWRYPVKSMAGEQLETADVASTGLTGDRAYALADMDRKRVGTAKSVRQFAGLLKCRAEFITPPDREGNSPVRITLADGKPLDSRQPDIDAQLAAAFGPSVSLVAVSNELLMESSAGTLGGKYIDTTESPVASAAPAGTLFDYSAIHIVTTATLRALAEAYPAGRFAIERFRPNLVVDCADQDGLVENGWIGKTLAVGADLVLRVLIPCPRCVMTTLPRTDLPLDPQILKTAARLNTQDLADFGKMPCVGVYAEVLNPGRIQVGDSVRIGS